MSKKYYYLTFLEERFRKDYKIKISTLTKKRLLDKGLPIFVYGFFSSKKLYPSTRFKMMFYNDEEYCVLGDLTWRGGAGDYFLAVKNCENESYVYQLWVKDGFILDEPDVINSDIDKFCLFIESYAVFSDTYGNKKYEKKEQIDEKEILRDFVGLVNLFKKEDKLGFNSDFWQEGLYGLKEEGYGEFLSENRDFMFRVLI